MHFSLDSAQDILDGGGVLPLLELRQVVDESVLLVDAGDVDLVDEFDLRSLFGVLLPAYDLQTIDPAVENSLTC